MKKRLSIFLMILTLLSSCKTKKMMEQPTYFPQKLTTEKVIEQLKTLDNIQTAEIKKMSIYLKMNDREFNVTSSMTMKKDSAINISIQPFFGMELFKVELTPDKITLYDKINQTYYTADYLFIANHLGFPVNFFDLQAMLTDRYFCLSAQTEKSCQLLSVTTEVINFGFENELLKQQMEILPDFRIKKVTLKDKIHDVELESNYENFDVVDGVIFPRKISIISKGSKSKNTSSVSIEKVKFNQPVEFTPIDIRRFKKGSFDQLFKK
ncbi:MAG: DUF4292 domain-containing protein [Paludibacteraceae bacterium]|nr:DUF4292 domain-containing protein [Paludibacteraceae bacterium]